MSTQIFSGVNGQARKVESIYAGVNGSARKVTAVYAGINNIARLAWKEASYAPDFGANSWEKISEAIANNEVPATWTVGSEKDITLTTGEVLTLQIYGVNHDDLAAGGKARFTLGMKHLTEARLIMNATSTNIGGFTGSLRYSWLIGEFWDTLPPELRAIIKPALKRTSPGDLRTDILVEAMPIFLFSEIEVFGEVEHSVPGEGFRYPIFTGPPTHLKHLSNGTGAAGFWWLRSPFRSLRTQFCHVSNTGARDRSLANVLRAICFGCCI